MPSKVSAQAYVEHLLDLASRIQVDGSQFVKSRLDDLVSNFREQCVELLEDRNLQVSLTCES